MGVPHNYGCWCGPCLRGRIVVLEAQVKSLQLTAPRGIYMNQNRTPVTNDNIIEAAARAAHEANRAYCIALGDTSQVPWDQAPEWQRSSCFNGARGVLVDGNGPRQSHESWLKEKADTGWKYGPTKDPEKKEHPCFVDYDRLPEAQRAKDDVFTHVVTVVASALGWPAARDGKPKEG